MKPVYPFLFSSMRIGFSLLLTSIALIILITPLALAGETVESDSSHSIFSNISINGYVENETATRLNSPQKISKFQNLIQLQFEGDISEESEFKVLTWALYDAVYDFYPGDYSDEVADEYGSNFTADDASDQIFREAYADIFLDSMDIRLGKQQVVWGEAIGLRIADIVNPVDYREFILDDFIDSRIPLWAANVTYYIGEFDLTCLWIPFFEPNRPALVESEWYWTFNRIEPPQGASLNMDEPEEPDADIGNSEYGFRLAGLVGGWNMSIMHLYAWDDTATRHVQFNSQEFVLDVDQRYHRLPMTGFTLANAYGSFVPRMELAYYLGKHFNTSDSAAEDGVVEKDFIHYMIGTDYSYSDYLLNVQFIQKRIFDYESDIYEDEAQNNFSFWLQANFLNETLKPEILALYDSNEGAWLIRPKTGYEINDQLIITLGLDAFTGPSRSFFGQFDSNDRMYMEIKYSF